jgi:integration host factor subunit beta
MLKSGLTRRLSEQNLHLYVRDLEKVVDAILEEIERALARGDRVEFRGFGTFAVKTWQARPGRNPSSGATIDVPERRYLSFRMGKEMLLRLNRVSPEASS